MKYVELKDCIRWESKPSHWFEVYSDMFCRPIKEFATSRLPDVFVNAGTESHLLGDLLLEVMKGNCMREMHPSYDGLTYTTLDLQELLGDEEKFNIVSTKDNYLKLIEEGVGHLYNFLDSSSINNYDGETYVFLKETFGGVGYNSKVGLNILSRDTLIKIKM